MTWDERLFEFIGGFFIGQNNAALGDGTRRTSLPRSCSCADSNLVMPHHIVIETHPDFRGRVEDELIAAAWQALAEFPAREIRADATSTHPELIAALEHTVFGF